MKHFTSKKSFTLIELLLSMTLLALLIVLFIGNYNTALKRGRDTQRKNDLSQLQKALEMYYEDNGTYPSFTDIFNTKLCTTAGCGATDTVYMIKTPRDPVLAYTYRYVPNASGSLYYLYSFIENDLDSGSGVSVKGFDTEVYCDSAKTTVLCRYYVGSSNAPQVAPNP